MYAPESFGESPNAASRSRREAWVAIRAHGLRGLLCGAVTAEHVDDLDHGRPGTARFAEVKAAHRPSDSLLLDRHGTPIQTVRVDKAVRRLASGCRSRDVAGIAARRSC
jgi:hypothetical protein